MSNALAEWLTPATIGTVCTGAGVVATKVIDALLARRKTQADASTETVKFAHASQEAVVRQLFDLVKTLRDDMTEMRAELEESEERRARAEDTVRMLRDEVHNLHNELRLRGFTRPAA